MGGFANSFAHAASEAVGKVAPALEKDAEAAIQRGLFNPAQVFKEHPFAAKIFDDYEKEYKPRVEKYSSQNAQKLQQSTAPVTADAIGVAKSEARKKATAEVFGPKRERIQQMLKTVEAQKGKNKADIMSNHFNVLFKEEAYDQGKNKGISAFDKDMMGSSKPGSKDGFNTPTTPYKGRNAVETFMGGIRNTLAFKAAPIHAATTALNLVKSDGLVNLSKTLYNIWGPGHDANINRILASDMISELHIQPMLEHYKFENGVISKFAPGSVGEFLHKNVFIPGMDATRRNSLYAGAESGRVMALEAANKLKAGKKQWAEQVFKTMNIDPAKVASQGFQLAPDDIDKAFYHGANNKVFLDPYDATPTFWRQSPTWRSVKAFSGYTTKQFQFERKVLQDHWAAGDYVGIARAVATNALAVPLVGALIYETDRQVMGMDHDKPLEHYKNRMEATPGVQAAMMLMGKSSSYNAAQTASNTLDMIARMGVFGNSFGYIRKTDRASLNTALTPPELNELYEGIQDVDKATHYDTNHPNAADPMMRDALGDIPSLGLGPQLSHYLLPTRAEKDAGKFKKYRKQKVSKPSNNPLNNGVGKY